MDIQVELTREAIDAGRARGRDDGGRVGAWVEFAGVVRGSEGGERIVALEYEAYESMALRVMREILERLGERQGCVRARVIHRVGRVPVGETAIWMGVGTAHRGEALALVSGFLDELKRDVPIWKCRAVRGSTGEGPA